MDINDAGIAGISLEALIKAADATDPMALGGHVALADLASNGLETLKTVSEKIHQQRDTEARTHTLVALLDEQTMYALGAAWRIQESKVLAFVATMRTVRGVRATVDDILRTIKRAASRQEAQLRERLRTSLGKSQDSRSFKTLANHSDIPKNLKLPPGWDVDSSGVYSIRISENGCEERDLLCPSPMIIVGRSVDIHNGETMLKLAWKRASVWIFKTVPRASVMDARPLVQLAKWDAPISSRNAGTLVQYFSDFEATNLECLPTDNTTGHLGWQTAKGSGGFLLGKNQIGLEDKTIQLVPDEGLDRLSDGWAVAGTWEEWLKTIEPALSRPMLMTAIYASVAAPLIQVLDAPNFIVDWSGETSKGKTTALRVAASVWGCPDERAGGIIYSWDATRVWIEQSAGFVHNLPLILDDTKRSRSNNVVSQVLYDFAFGQGRGRGSPNGVRKQARWRSVLLTTGESPATGFSEDAGTRARVISLKGAPMGEVSTENARAAMSLTLGLLENHGHLGLKLVTHLVNTRHRWDELRAKYRDTRDSYVASAGGNGVAARLAVYVSVLDMAAQIIHELGVPCPTVDPMEMIWESVSEGSREADRPMEALRDMAGWCVANQTRFWGRHETDKMGSPNMPVGGWAGTWKQGEHWESIAIFPSLVRDLLRRWEYDVNGVIESWHRRGALVTNGRSRTRPVSIDGQRARCTVISRSAIDSLIGPDE
tara:strand:- start:3258 stop:5396 length:2139 start_codon:yes stop_codon:yes gene_type:complete